MNKSIYLDYNATTPIRPEVITMMNDIMGMAHNASSVHIYGRAGRKYIEDAREHVARLAGIPSAQIIFNSGATEGNNTVLRHFAGERLIISAIEHPSVTEAAIDADCIAVTRNGVVDLDTLEESLKTRQAALVSIMLVNNETGVIQPIREISSLVHKYGALLHCDGVQAAGRIKIDMAEMGIDFLTLSAHKIGGPQGVGALCLGLCGITPTLLHGGGQEKSARAGTENIAGIAGFGKAVALALDNIEAYQNTMEQLKLALEDTLGGMEDVTIYGQNADRVANTTLFSISGLSSETLLMALDLEGIAVSNGSACSSGRVEPSHVIRAMGGDDADAMSAIRISWGWDSTQSDIDAFLDAFGRVYSRIKL